jgi:Na+-translocating ferredoxin:NAD+ oxidoreductase RnfD subunit
VLYSEVDINQSRTWGMILCQRLVLSLRVTSPLVTLSETDTFLAGYFAVTYSVRNWYFPCGLLRRYLLCQKLVLSLRVTSPLLTLSETGTFLAGYFAVTYSVRNWYFSCELLRVTYSVRNWYFPCGLLRRYLLC